MKKTNHIIAVLLIGMTCGCGGQVGQKTYYWEQDGYGAEQFGVDHEGCMRYADWFPFNTNANWFGPTVSPRHPTYTADSGIWAYYEPFKGAQPVYVNYSMGDYTVRDRKYRKCMHELGYREKYAPYKNRPVGTLRCNTINCERNDFEDGTYRPYQPR